jgi:putative acetyltransferase
VNSPSGVLVRPEQPDDIPAIREINGLAFGQDLEGRIVDALRANGAIHASLVATIGDRIVGHILFSPVRLEGEVVLAGTALGPMAVLPELQRHGVGSMLVEEGIRRMRDRGAPFVIVLGHPEYYPRFGFVPASRYQIRSTWDVPDPVFMVLPLSPGSLPSVPTTAKYRAEFDYV